MSMKEAIVYYTEMLKKIKQLSQTIGKLYSEIEQSLLSLKPLRKSRVEIFGGVSYLSSWFYVGNKSSHRKPEKLSIYTIIRRFRWAGELEKISELIYKRKRDAFTKAFKLLQELPKLKSYEFKMEKPYTIPKFENEKRGVEKIELHLFPDGFTCWFHTSERLEWDSTALWPIHFAWNDSPELRQRFKSIIKELYKNIEKTKIISEKIKQSLKPFITTKRLK